LDRSRCWEALHGRSEREVEQARQGLARAIERVGQLESQAERLQAMHDDYQRRMAQAQEQPQAMSRSVAYRSFLAQIGSLIQRVNADLEAARSVVAGARRVLLRCEQTRGKYEMLLEREDAIEQERVEHAEGRMLEEFAVGRFLAQRRRDQVLD
jgi:flagellar export protein FliJ